MIKNLLLSLAVLFFLMCASPAHFLSNVVPQKSIPGHAYGDSTASKRVLIGGLTSPFKEAIAKSITDSLVNDSVYVKTVGLKDLRKAQPTEWNAVLILNTCMAWEINFKVKRYVKKFPGYGSFVVVTTAGNPPCSTPKKLPKNIDALSMASENQKCSEVAAKALASIREKINK